MAQFTAQGRLKLPFNNDGANWKLLGNDFVGGLRSFQSRKRKIRFLGTSGTRLYPASSMSKKPQHFYTEASQSVSDVNDESEKDYERDELACFRGLVLDISYRYLMSFNSHNSFTCGYRFIFCLFDKVHYLNIDC